VPQQEARAEAIRRAKEALAAELATGREGLPERCARLGLPGPSSGPAPAGAILEFPLFGSPAILDLPSLTLSGASGAARTQAEEILFLHYLSHPGRVEPQAGAGGDASGLISFRDLAGGAFYWEPFRSRTCLPLAKRYATDLPGLRSALDRFDWSEIAAGDFGARVHAMGNLFVTLVYYSAEEGIETEVLVLFDPAIKRVFQAEDAAAVASRICLGLL
jgi:hypothetical protein